MSGSESSIAAQLVAGIAASVWIEPPLGLGLGALGGALQSALLTTSLAHGIFLGGLFGLAFCLFFAQRATSPGAGLIWGVCSAFLLWVTSPAGLLPMLRPSGHSPALWPVARAHFPALRPSCLSFGRPTPLPPSTPPSPRTTP